MKEKKDISSEAVSMLAIFSIQQQTAARGDTRFSFCNMQSIPNFSN